MPAREVAVVVFSKSGFKVSEHFQEHKRKKLFSLYKHNNELFVLLNWKRRLFLGNKIIKPKKNPNTRSQIWVLKKIPWLLQTQYFSIILRPNMDNWTYVSEPIQAYFNNVKYLAYVSEVWLTHLISNWHSSGVPRVNWHQTSPVLI